MKLYFILCCSILIIHFCDSVNGDVRGLLSKLREPLPTIEQSFRIVFRDSSEDTGRRDQTATRVYKNELPVTSATHSEVLETTTQPVTAPTTIANNVTTTVKEGKENFAGGCATGFMRTADGRCKPTFG